MNQPSRVAQLLSSFSSTVSSTSSSPSSAVQEVESCVSKAIPKLEIPPIASQNNEHHNGPLEPPLDSNFVAKRPRYHYHPQTRSQQRNILTTLPPLPRPILPPVHQYENQPPFQIPSKLPSLQSSSTSSSLLSVHSIPVSSSSAQIYTRTTPAAPQPSTPTGCGLTPITSPITSISNILTPKSTVPRELTPGRLIIQTLVTNPKPLHPDLQASLLNKNKLNNSHVTSLQRETIVDWLANASFRLNLRPQTYAVCVRILDELLCLNIVTRNKLLTLATSCLFIACKLEEWKPISCKVIGKMMAQRTTKNALRHLKDDDMEKLIVAGERFILQHLHYDIYKQTSVGVAPWITLKSIENDSDLSNNIDHDTICKDAEFITLIGLLDEKVSSMPVSTVAIAATRIALCIHGKGGSGLVEWLNSDYFKPGEFENAVITLIAAWHNAKQRKGGCTVIRLLNDIAKCFDSKDRDLRALVDGLHEEVDVLTRRSISDSPSTPGGGIDRQHRCGMGGDGLLRGGPRVAALIRKRKR